MHDQHPRRFVLARVLAFQVDNASRLNIAWCKCVVCHTIKIVVIIVVVDTADATTTNVAVVTIATIAVGGTASIAIIAVVGSGVAVLLVAALMGICLSQFSGFRLHKRDQGETTQVRIVLSAHTFLGCELKNHDCTDNPQDSEHHGEVWVDTDELALAT